MPEPHRFSKSPQTADTGRTSPKLRLLVTGFSAQDLVSTQEIVAAVDRLPAFHLEHLREISYEPGIHGLPTLVGANQGQKIYRTGEYIQRSRRIVIYYFDSSALFFQMLLHEIGHHVFFLILNSKVKKRWVTHLHRSAPCITPYAQHSAAEDFAETYAAFVLDPGKLRNIPSKYKFMREEVFSGLPGMLKEKN